MRAILLRFLLLGSMLILPLAQVDRADAQTNLPAIDANTVKILARTTIVAVNHANRTGNYAVLRELGSPGFRDNNNPAQLAGIFAQLRSKNLDFGPIVLFDPVFTQQPAYNEQGLLQMAGYFPTRPLEVVFNMSFMYVSQRWVLEAIVIDTRSADDTPNPRSSEEGFVIE